MSSGLDPWTDEVFRLTGRNQAAWQKSCDLYANRETYSSSVEASGTDRTPGGSEGVSDISLGFVTRVAYNL